MHSKRKITQTSNHLEQVLFFCLCNYKKQYPQFLPILLHLVLGVYDVMVPEVREPRLPFRAVRLLIIRKVTGRLYLQEVCAHLGIQRFLAPYRQHSKVFLLLSETN